jgi:hypothetical protein
MRMFNKSLFSVSALLALGALGCGDSGEESNTPVNQPDSGPGITTMDGGINLNQCQTVFGITGKLCTQANGQQGYQTCVNNMPQGPCNPISFGGDGGVGQLPFDGGFTLTDGGIKIGDATINIEAGTLKCPASFQCSPLGSGAGLPASYCTADGIFPPACTTPGSACMVGTANGSCQAVPLIGNGCIVPCN